MNTPLALTEKHRKTAIESGRCFSTGYLENAMCVIAESEAKATEERDERIGVMRYVFKQVLAALPEKRDWLDPQLEKLMRLAENDQPIMQSVVAERDQLRAEAERLKKDVIEQGERTVKAQDALEASILRTADQRLRAEKAEAEAARWKREDARDMRIIERLEIMIGKQPGESPYDAVRRIIARADKAKAELTAVQSHLDGYWRTNPDTASAAEAAMKDLNALRLAAENKK
jgi:hypothetical protein